MPIATHLLIGHELPYWLMCGNCHTLAEKATKRHRHEQQCKAARRHPFSLVDNIKFYFINNTRHFNARLNYILIYIMSGLSAIFEGIVAVLGS